MNNMFCNYHVDYVAIGETTTGNIFLNIGTHGINLINFTYVNYVIYSKY